MTRRTPVYFEGSIDEAIERYRHLPPMLIEDILPTEGVAILHGKYSLGKSPFGWALAQSVSEGFPFFGHPVTRAGQVVWLEIDEPLSLSTQRLKLLAPRPSRFTLVGLKALNVLDPSPDTLETLQRMCDLDPRLVVINSLRKSHALSDIDSASVEMVYGAAMDLFPDACVLFIHHDKKQGRDMHGRPLPSSDSDFAGSQAWVNNAQIGLHMTAMPKGEINIASTKSQAGQKYEHLLRLKLQSDGVTWQEKGSFVIREAYRTLDPALPKMKRYEIVAEQVGVCVKTVRRALDTAA